MEISLIKDEHFSFSNDTSLSINEKGVKMIINAIFGDEPFIQELFTREFAAETIDILLDNDITRKIMFESIRGKPEYKQQITKILSED